MNLEFFGKTDSIFLSAALIVAASWIAVSHSLLNVDERESGTYWGRNVYKLRGDWIRRYNAICSVVLGALGVLVGVFSEFVTSREPFFGYWGSTTILPFLIIILVLVGKEISTSFGLRKFREIVIPQERELFGKLEKYFSSGEGYNEKEISEGSPHKQLNALLSIFFLEELNAVDHKEKLDRIRPFFQE